MATIIQQLEEQYRETAPSLRAYFRRRPVTRGSADDLVQETFLRAWRCRDRLGSATSVRAYLFGIARHLVLDACRQQPSAPPTALADIPADATEAADERMELLRAAIDRLSESHREPLRLKLRHELSYAEIADVLGLPIGTVRSRLHYAIESLHVRLNPGSGATGKNFEP